MVNFDTPQSKALKKLHDTYASLDLNNVAPLLSKDFQYELFPKTPDVPNQTKESHLEMWGKVFSSFNKLEYIYHEVISEASGKVVIHFTSVFSTASGARFNYDSISIYTLVEEDGELKLLHCKVFGDPKQCSDALAGAAAEKGAAQ